MCSSIHTSSAVFVEWLHTLPDAVQSITWPKCSLIVLPQVQTISFLSHLRSNGVNGPFLIIGPLSTLRNWVSEVRRFCPSMPVLEYHGNGAKARAQLRKQHMPPGKSFTGPHSDEHSATFLEQITAGNACWRHHAASVTDLLQ